MCLSPFGLVCIKILSRHLPFEFGMSMLFSSLKCEESHSMGHLGLTKTKQMLRARYWFPALNSMVEDIIGRCYECKVTTKEHRQEPIKPTKIPETAWNTLAADYGGPYPDGHYNLVVIDKRTRANGEAENFMKLLNKTEQIAHMKGNHSNDAIQDMLMGYRSTPHPATGFTPYAALMNRDVRTKSDHKVSKSSRCSLGSVRHLSSSWCNQCNDFKRVT
ncbi:unnamed protein product [Mytilus edulis]|uniref:Integrase zinc-binding domain-containing protein n=1 Tax=Mytilus edulis TaxID=6550 RepID=A0A8S3PSA1_MYTED|nr:unnamed protein product [Mytilus edulis]